MYNILSAHFHFDYVLLIGPIVNKKWRHVRSVTKRIERILHKPELSKGLSYLAPQSTAFQQSHFIQNVAAKYLCGLGSLENTGSKRFMEKGCIYSAHFL